MQVELCKNGIKAIEAVKSKDYDLILMDHKMPEMDGVETTKRIRKMGETNPYFKLLPIIALTANAVIGMETMFLENGLNDLLTKPINTTQLNTILEKWIWNFFLAAKRRQGREERGGLDWWFENSWKLV